MIVPIDTDQQPAEQNPLSPNDRLEPGSPPGIRPVRFTGALLIGIVLVGLVLRLGAATASNGYSWDSGQYYVPMIENLGGALRGEVFAQFGRERPGLVPLGFPAAVRAVQAVTGLGVRDAGQLLCLVAGLGMLPLVFLLGQHVGGPRVGLASATVFAVHTDALVYSVTGGTESLFLFLIMGGLLAVILPERLERRHTVLAAVLIGAAAFVRTAGIASGPALLGLLLLRYRRGQASRAAWLIGASVLVAVDATAWGLHSHIASLAGAFPGIEHSRLALFELGHFPEAFWADSTGGTLRLVSAEVPLGSILTLGRAFEILAKNAVVYGPLLCPPLLLGVAGICLLSKDRRLLYGGVLLFALAPLALTVAVLSPANSRYSFPCLPLIYPFAIAALVRGGERLLADRIRLSARASLTTCVLLVLGLALFLWPPRGLVGLLGYGHGNTWRERSQRAADEFARHLPPDAVLAQGPGGAASTIALAGFNTKYLASGPNPAAIEHYVRLNNIQWVVFSEGSWPLVRAALPRARFEDVIAIPLDGGRQVVTRILLPE